MIYEDNKPVRMDTADALRSLYPTKKWRYNEETGVAWVSTDIPAPSAAELDTEVQRLQAEWEAKEYARNRKAEYPHLKEFAEAYTEKEIGGDSTKWDTYIINYNKVRTENPK